jgi:hypothetical protein
MIDRFSMHWRNPQPPNQQERVLPAAFDDQKTSFPIINLRHIRIPPLYSSLSPRATEEAILVATRICVAFFWAVFTGAARGVGRTPVLVPYDRSICKLLITWTPPIHACGNVQGPTAGRQPTATSRLSPDPRFRLHARRAASVPGARRALKPRPLPGRILLSWHLNIIHRLVVASPVKPSSPGETWAGSLVLTQTC